MQCNRSVFDANNHQRFENVTGLTGIRWHFLRWIANHWRRVLGRPATTRRRGRVADKSSANRAATVKATGNYKSRKRKRRKDELLISPGVILASDPRDWLWPIRFSVSTRVSRFFLPSRGPSCPASRDPGPPEVKTQAFVAWEHMKFVNTVISSICMTGGESTMTQKIFLSNTRIK